MIHRKEYAITFSNGKELPLPRGYMVKRLAGAAGLRWWNVEETGFKNRIAAKVWAVRNLPGHTEVRG